MLTWSYIHFFAKCGKYDIHQWDVINGMSYCHILDNTTITFLGIKVVGPA